LRLVAKMAPGSGSKTMLDRSEALSETRHRHDPEEHAEIMAQVRSWREIIERNADVNDEADCLGREVIDLLENSNILNLNVPRVCGGTEAHPLLGIDAISTLSWFDGSTGWYAGASMTGSAIAGAYLGDRAVEQIFAAGAPRCAGQAAPGGKAEKVGDSYRLSGDFTFGSGIPSANWVIGGYVVHEDGAPLKTATGVPKVILGFVPRAKIELRGNWDVIGLRGTASFDFRVPEQLIHEDFTIDPLAIVAKRGGPLYGMGGFRAFACIHQASVAIGCTTRALEEWVALAKHMPRLVGGTANQQHTVQHDMALGFGEIRAIEAYVQRTFTDLYEESARGDRSDRLRLDARLSSSMATIRGAAITQRAFNSCTSTVLRNGNRLQRCYRDMQAAAAHMLTGETSLIQLGAFLADAPGAKLDF
jgi:alkylation response protein AidB-like acyl-CoA dehydrogenase